MSVSRSNRKIGRFLTEAVLLIAIVATIIPIGWLLYNSFKFSKDIISLDNPLQFTLYNYRSLFSDTSTFTALFFNSIGLVVSTTILCLAVGLLAAYSLSKFRWPRSVTLSILGAATFVQLVPPVALAPSFYVILNNFYLYDSVTGLVLVNTVFNLPFAIFLLKVYFDSVPDDLREAALVDGCGEAKVFWRVMVPLAAPGVAAVAILVGILTWNEFLMALSLTSTPNGQTITVGIATFIQEFQVLYGDMSAAAAVATVPLIVLAGVAHRYIVTGLTGGAVKG